MAQRLEKDGLKTCVHHLPWLADVLLHAGAARVYNVDQEQGGNRLAKENLNALLGRHVIVPPRRDIESDDETAIPRGSVFG
jgi:hypothetical protein